MVREALTVLGLAVLVSGTLGALIYLGADALMEFAAPAGGAVCGNGEKRGAPRPFH